MSDDPSKGAPRWDLSRLYSGVDDPKLQTDLEELERMASAFHDAFHDRVAELLGAALYAYEQIDMREQKLTGYLELLLTERLEEELAIRQHEIVSRWEDVRADKLSFFEQEVSELDDARLESLTADDAIARSYLGWIKELREEAKHYLDDEAEEALAKREAYGSESWYLFYKRTIGQLPIAFEGETKSANDLDSIWRRDPDRDRRRRALETLNGILKERIVPLSAQALNMIVGEKAVDDRDRGYDGPMAERNLENRVSQELMDGVAAALQDVVYPTIRRYARLKAGLLGIPAIDWADLWGPYPFAAYDRIPFEQALDWSLRAFRSIDACVAERAEKLVNERYLDAEPRARKYTGACCQNFVLPNRQAAPYVVMSYYGSMDDASTLCHELMHGINDQFLVPEHGPIRSFVSSLNAEMAGVVGDELWYQTVRHDVEAADDPRRLLGLVLYRLELNLFYLAEYGWNWAFERRIHAAKRPLKAEEYGQLWMESLRDVFGPDGRNISTASIDAYWSMIELAGDPFYVAAYPTALPTMHSVLARRKDLGEKFAGMFVDFLRNNSIMPIDQLVAPFGVDVRDPHFFRRGMRACLDPLMTEAEKLANQLGLLTKT